MFVLPQPAQTAYWELTQVSFSQIKFTLSALIAHRSDINDGETTAHIVRQLHNAAGGFYGYVIVPAESLQHPWNVPYKCAES